MSDGGVVGCSPGRVRELDGLPCRAWTVISPSGRAGGEARTEDRCGAPARLGTPRPGDGPICSGRASGGHSQRGGFSLHAAGHAALRFDGLQAYHGAAQHIRGFSERKAAIDHAIAATRATIDDLTAAGLPPAIVGGAGTGTFRFEGTSGVYTEIQAGSYVFMDADYGRVLDADGDPMHEFEHSLFVLATVMSRVADDRVIIDGGLKSFAVDSGLPLVADHDEAIYVSASDEHGRLSVSGAARAIALGDRLRPIPGHCDPTVNLHDWYVGVRGDVVETVWPVAARGAVF